MKIFRSTIMLTVFAVVATALFSSAQLCAQPISNLSESSCLADRAVKREALQRAIDRLANQYADNFVSTLILSSGY
jgi:hypothetical protein